MAFDAPLPSKPEKLSYNEFINILKPPSMSLDVKGCQCDMCQRARGLPPSKPEDDLAILKKARARIAQGWCQGKTMDENRNVCAMGGILFAIAGEENIESYNSFIQGKMERIARLLPGISQTCEVVKFNDTQGRTKEEVLRLFDYGIKRLEAGLPPPVRPQPLYHFA